LDNVSQQQQIAHNRLCRTVVLSSRKGFLYCSIQNKEEVIAYFLLLNRLFQLKEYMDTTKETFILEMSPFWWSFISFCSESSVKNVQLRYEIECEKLNNVIFILFRESFSNFQKIKLYCSYIAYLAYMKRNSVKSEKYFKFLKIR